MTGLTFDEFVELKLRPLPHADWAFHEAAQQESHRIFPMPTFAVAQHLRTRGFDVNTEMLETIIRSGRVTPRHGDLWSQEDVETAACYFDEHGFWTPYAVMCSTLGCSYGDYLRALREAAVAAWRQYGKPIPEDDQYFVMHRHPPRGGLDEHGQPILIPARIEFTLCDDVRRDIEAGKEI